MFDRGSETYRSDIKLGERYRDEQTGFEGIATAVYFFQHACERVSVETYDPARLEVKTETFDAPRLVHVDSGVKAKTTRTGGPAMPHAARPAGPGR